MKVNIQIDSNGYEHEQATHSDLTHRLVAYKNIYLKNREKYPLPFSKYQVHHRDFNKRNNSIENLEIYTKEEHECLHGMITICNNCKKKIMWGYKLVKSKQIVCYKCFYENKYTEQIRLWNKPLNDLKTTEKMSEPHKEFLFSLLRSIRNEN